MCGLRMEVRFGVLDLTLGVNDGLMTEVIDGDLRPGVDVIVAQAVP